MEITTKRDKIVSDLSTKLVNTNINKDLKSLSTHALEVSLDNEKYAVWQENSLMSGRFGIITMMLNLNNFSNQQFNNQFSAALNSVQQNQGVSIFDGLSGVGNVLLSTNKFDFKNIINQITHYLDGVTNNLSSGVSDTFIEHGYGLSGIGQFYLQRYDSGEDVSDTILKIQDYYINRFQTNLDYNQLINEWSFPTAGQDSIDVNLSVSHGIAGVMIFLLDSSIRLGNRKKVDILIQKMHHIISKNYKWDNDNLFRTYAMNLDTNTNILDVSRNDSWCYGTLGFEIAMLKYAIYKHDNLEIANSLKSIKYVVENPMYTDNFSICHGLAGSLLIGKIINKFFKKDIIDISESEKRLLDGYSSTEYFGYADKKFGAIDDPDYLTTDLGMLTGISGIVYSLSLNTDINTSFDYALGISMMNYTI